MKAILYYNQKIFYAGNLGECLAKLPHGVKMVSSHGGVYEFQPIKKKFYFEQYNLVVVKPAHEKLVKLLHKLMGKDDDIHNDSKLGRGTKTIVSGE